MPGPGSVYVHWKYARPSGCAAIDAFQSNELPETNRYPSCFAVFAPAPSVSYSNQDGIGNTPKPVVLIAHRLSPYCVGSLMNRPSLASISQLGAVQAGAAGCWAFGGGAVPRFGNGEIAVIAE